MRLHARPRWTATATLAAALAWPAAVCAGPVSGDAPAADPYELALNWTLTSLSAPAARTGTAEMPTAAVYPAMQATSPPLAVPAGGVPDPGAYALMGLALLCAGLAARHWAARQRGLSKKT